MGGALGAGLVAGLVLVIVPCGSPWALLTFFTPTVLGRNVSSTMMLPRPVLWAIHLSVSVLYGLVMSVFVSRLGNYKAILAGSVVGLVLYLVKWCVVNFVWPAWRVGEIPVVFTHLVFGLVAAGAYRGLLRRCSIEAHPAAR
jgi:uncharacterized membrane protein YGL010W